jgi:hypothetical protein
VELVWRQPPVEWVRLHDGVRVIERRGMMSLAHPWGTMSLDATEPAIVDALWTLAEQPVLVSEVDLMVGTADPVRLARWYLVLDIVRGLFVHELRAGARPLLWSVPLAADAVHRWATWRSDAVARLSRFTVLRDVDAALMADSPLSFRRVVLDDPAVRQVVEVLVAPVSREELAAAVPAVAPVVAKRVAEFLAACGLLRFAVRPPDVPLDDWQTWELPPRPREHRRVSHAGRCRERANWHWRGQAWTTCSRSARR